MSIPSKKAATMKSVIIAAHGTNVDELLSMTDERPKPVVRKPGELLVKVQACALAPGDVRVMKGECDYFQSPGTFPYIPGGDLSGIVQEADETSRFRKGDCIMAMFQLPRPLNGLAEYAIVKETNAEWRPKSIDAIQAAALTSSALAALLAVHAYVKPGDRILVLGGSGGVSTFFVQLARNAGASFIACTSTAKELLLSLGVDRVIDYRNEQWWEIPQFASDPFDIILDTVGGREPWDHARDSKTLKRKGCYVVMNGDEPFMQLHNFCQTLRFMSRIEGRHMWTSLWPWVPTYIWHQGLEIKEGHLKELGTLIDEGNLKVVLDTVTPVPFETESVKAAFKLMESRHAHGKVVIQIQQ